MAFPQTCLSFEVLLYDRSLTVHGARLPGGRRVCQPPSSSVQGSLRGSSAGIPHFSRCAFLLPALCPSKPKLAVLVKLGKAHVAYRLVQHWEASVRFCTSGGNTVSPPEKEVHPFCSASLLPRPRIVGGRQGFLFPGCLLLSPAPCCGWGGEMVSPLCSLSTKHCRAFSQREMGR